MKRYLELEDIQRAEKLAIENNENEFATSRLIAYLTDKNQLELAQKLAVPFIYKNSHIALQVIKCYKKENKIAEAVHLADYFPNNEYIQKAIDKIDKKELEKNSVSFSEEICEIIKDINYSGVATLELGYYNNQSKMRVLKTLILEGYSSKVKEEYPDEFKSVYNKAKTKNNHKNKNIKEYEER